MREHVFNIARAWLVAGFGLLFLGCCGLILKSMRMLLTHDGVGAWDCMHRVREPCMHAAEAALFLWQ
jgi:hypothetical protein